jgi:hypothetical protein
VPLLQEDALRVLHNGLRHLRRVEVQALLDTAAPHDRDAQTSAAFQVAGEMPVYGARVLACVQCLEMLDALDADAIADKARLRCCLTHPLPATTATAPAP